MSRLVIKFADMGGAAGEMVGRQDEMLRLVRILAQAANHHVLLSGEPGCGKTSMVDELARQVRTGRYGQLPGRMYRLDTEPIMAQMVNGSDMAAAVRGMREAASKLGRAVVVIEDMHLLAGDDPIRMELLLSLLQPLVARPEIRLLATLTDSAYRRRFEGNYMVDRLFAHVALRPAEAADARDMAVAHVVRLQQAYGRPIEPSAVPAAVKYGARFGRGRALPDAAIRLLEETCSRVGLDGGDAIRADDIGLVVSERERVPLGSGGADEAAGLVTLSERLAGSVLGQPAAVRTVARTIQRSRLGLADPQRPRGSFLMLGPSGVGKTETARALARELYGSDRSLVRLDMSEFAEPHMSVRLTGSPPGYVGFEEGGQLTNPVAREPYSLVLLDELEKAHARVYDIFLQVLDDARLTDSTGRTVNFADTVIMATSNLAAERISADAAAGAAVESMEYLQESLMPELMRVFRPEFINRFDAVLVYRPLDDASLMAIARRELSRLERRLRRHDVRIQVSDEVLAGLMQPFHDVRMGARPVKRMIARRFEAPLAERLLLGQAAGLSISGEEPWLMD